MITPLQHISIVMDGNYRWAEQQGKPGMEGHKEGALALKRVVESSVKLGIPFLTVYGFSAENWARSPEEVDGLMNLLRTYLDNEVPSLIENGIRLRVLGDVSRFDEELRQAIYVAESHTAGESTLCLSIALSYGGRQEIVEAVRQIASKVCSGKVGLEAINEDMVADHLYTRDIPDPDLLIRPGGEKRLSNFLLWQHAYSEFVFIDTLWPDFGEADLQAAIHAYSLRKRRYGLRVI